jgi:hypothetical protein
MRVQVLWVPPAERRFGSGDILTAEELAAFGEDAATLLSRGDAQVLDPPTETDAAPAQPRRKARKA